jgi:hypothetical protein
MEMPRDVSLKTNHVLILMTTFNGKYGKSKGNGTEKF